MISQDGSIHFAGELVSLIDRCLDEYREVQGMPDNPLERGLIIAYMMEVMRCDLELLGDCLNGEDVFKGLSPDEVLRECSGNSSDELESRREKLREMLYDRGWLPLSNV